MYHKSCNSTYRLRYWNIFFIIITRFYNFKVATVPTVYGIETSWIEHIVRHLAYLVATVPTVYGIETTQRSDARYSKSTMLQQYLPFTVLKPVTKLVNGKRVKELQQYLPFTVLKLATSFTITFFKCIGCNSTYRLRYWNETPKEDINWNLLACCNSTYRLRYWNLVHTASYHNYNTLVATVPTVYGIETRRHFHRQPWLSMVATVLTVYGVETHQNFRYHD